MVVRMRCRAQSDIAGFLAFMEETGHLTPETVRRVDHACRETSHPADMVLIELGLVGEGDLARYLADYLGCKALARLPEPPNVDLIGEIGIDFLAANQIIPIDLDDEHVTIALADPFVGETIEAISYFFERSVRLAIVPRNVIAGQLEQLQNDGDTPPDDPADQAFGDQDGDDIDRLRDSAREAPVIRFVARIIQQAVDRGATDLHIEPLADSVQIRFRCDGLLVAAEKAPKAIHAGIATRIKILSRLNIAERRLPQDGRMRMAVRGRQVDLRVSVLPSTQGETIVLRVLDRSGIDLKLDALGFDRPAIDALRRLVHAPNGIVLVTGPTGSGKTTTLYALLRERVSTQLKIFTVEDPVEYRLEGITQMQIDPTIGLTFAGALRSVLRQDPDIILIGEIRDRESAQIAIQASLTGHLVLSTLHTNNAIGALTRLRDMGLDDYLIAATIRAVIAQRLVRNTCPCGNTGGEAEDACPSCRGTGFAGRRAIYEIAEVTPQLAAMICARAREDQLDQHNRQCGAASMADHAETLVASGVTTRDEVRRVLELGGI